MRKILPILMSVGVLLTWSTLPRYVAFAQTATESGSSELDELTDELEKVSKALEETLQTIPRDTFDPQAVVDDVGDDPVKLFEWVRDHTFWVPYQGALRGPTGVLMDRLGNSLDRALLLAELLSLPGHRVRLARAELSEEQAGQIIGNIRPVPADRLAQPMEQLQEADVLGLAAKYELDSKKLIDAFENLRTSRQEKEEQLSRRVSRQTDVITTQLAEILSEHPVPESAKTVASLQDHWWVQWRDGREWIDLDPLLPDSEVGNAHADPRTVQYRKREGKLVLPRRQFHEVEIRVIVEQWARGRLREHVVLEHTIRPLDLEGSAITFQNYPMDWPSAEDLFNTQDFAQRLKEAAQMQTEWVPILSIGSEMIYEKAFTSDGSTHRASFQPAATGNLLGNAAGRLGLLDRVLDDRAGGERNELASNSFLTAQWLEYEVRSPGESTREIRRQIFDLIGPALRETKNVEELELTGDRQLERNLAVLGSTKILLQPYQISSQFVDDSTARTTLANLAILLGSLKESESVDTKETLTRAAEMTSVPFELYALALTRDRYRDDLFVDQPNILSFHNGPVQSPGGDLVSQEGFDIVENYVAVRRGFEDDPRLARIRQGILDTNAEALLLDGQSKFANTSEIFDQEMGSGVKWLVISSTDEDDWQEVTLPADIRSRIEQAVNDGYVVIVPERPVSLEERNETSVAWWRIDPHTGSTLGIGPTGGGQAMTQREILDRSLHGAVFWAACVLVRTGDKARASNLAQLKSAFACAGVAAALALKGPIPTVDYNAIQRVVLVLFYIATGTAAGGA